MKTRRVFLAALVLTALVSSSYAGIIVDVRPAPGTGYTVQGNNVVFDAPGVYEVNLGLYATVTGANGVATDESLTTLYSGVDIVPQGSSANAAAFATTGSVAVNNGLFTYQAPYVNSTTAITVSASRVGPADGLGTNGWFKSLATSGHADTFGNDAHLLTTFKTQATVSAVDGQTFATLSFLKPPASISIATFRVDNGSLTGSASSGYSQITGGTSVNLVAVPEPGTFVLLGMGGMGIGLCLWRRKRA